MIAAAVSYVDNMVYVFAVVVASVFVLADTASSGDDVGSGGFPAGWVGPSFATVPVVCARGGGHSVMTISLLDSDITIVLCASGIL